MATPRREQTSLIPDRMRRPRRVATGEDPLVRPPFDRPPTVDALATTRRSLAAIHRANNPAAQRLMMLVGLAGSSVG